MTLNLQKLALGVRSKGTIKTAFVCLKSDVSYFINEQRQKFHTTKYLSYTCFKALTALCTLWLSWEQFCMRILRAWWYSAVLLLRSSPWFTIGVRCVIGDTCTIQLHLWKLLKCYSGGIFCSVDCCGLFSSWG